MLFRDGKPAPARGPAHSVDVVIKADAPEITGPGQISASLLPPLQASERPTFRLVLRPNRAPTAARVAGVVESRVAAIRVEVPLGREGAAAAGGAMTARVIHFPARQSHAIWVTREDTAWLVSPVATAGYSAPGQLAPATGLACRQSRRPRCARPRHDDAPRIEAARFILAECKQVDLRIGTDGCDLLLAPPRGMPRESYRSVSTRDHRAPPRDHRHHHAGGRAVTTPTEIRLQLRAGGFSPYRPKAKCRRWRDGRRSSTPPTPKSDSGLRPGTSRTTPASSPSSRPGPTSTSPTRTPPRRWTHLAREHFEERGKITMRIGQWPKRLIPLRTDEPFAKLTRAFRAPDGTRAQDRGSV